MNNQKKIVGLLESTAPALGKKLLCNIIVTKFCIVGCGGVGANIADMLVRTGATKLCLIDGDKVELKNLNRTPFTTRDIGECKVTSLRKHLLSINKEASIAIKGKYFITSGEMKNLSEIKVKEDHQEIRDVISNSDVVIIAFDQPDKRIDCYKLCSDGKSDWLSIGLEINKKYCAYWCLWNYDYKSFAEPKHEGYGEDNSSYGSIVMEACSVGINLLLYNLSNPDNPEKKICKKYYQFILNERIKK